MLRSDEPDLKEEATSYQLLPKARTCPEGTAGDWSGNGMVDLVCFVE